MAAVLPCHHSHMLNSHSWWWIKVSRRALMSPSAVCSHLGHKYVNLLPLWIMTIFSEWVVFAGGHRWSELLYSVNLSGGFRKKDATFLFTILSVPTFPPGSENSWLNMQMWESLLSVSDAIRTGQHPASLVLCVCQRRFYLHVFTVISPCWHFSGCTDPITDARISE